MIRRINFTGRIKIPSKMVKITLTRRGKDIHSFNSTIDLSELDLPENGKVYVEAYQRSVIRRYDFGTVKEIEAQEPTELDFFENPEQLQFKIKVVDDEGKILAKTKPIRPEIEGRKTPLLSVKPDDEIGKELWFLDFEDEPLLLLNRKISGIESIAYESQFRQYTCPSILREILTQMIFVGKIGSLEWHDKWLKFVKKITPQEEIPEILDHEDTRFNSQEVNRWIKKAARRFSNRMKDEWKDVKRQIEVEK